MCLDAQQKGMVIKMKEQDIMNHFADSITEWREELGMTAKDFASHVGISENTLYNYESGRTMPMFYTAVQIAERLGTSLDGLIGRSPHA